MGHVNFHKIISQVNILVVAVSWLFDVPTTCKVHFSDESANKIFTCCQDRNCRSNLLSHPLTVYWQWVNVTNPSTDPIAPGALEGDLLRNNLLCHLYSWLNRVEWALIPLSPTLMVDFSPCDCKTLTLNFITCLKSVAYILRWSHKFTMPQTLITNPQQHINSYLDWCRTMLENEGRNVRFHKPISMVPDQNGISPLYNILEIYHSGPEPSMSSRGQGHWIG